MGLSVAALSSRDVNMRKAGYHVLSRYMMHLDGARFREKKQVGSPKQQDRQSARRAGRQT